MAINVDEILNSAFTSNIIFLDNFENFLDDRATNLWQQAVELTQSLQQVRKVSNSGTLSKLYYIATSLVLNNATLLNIRINFSSLNK